MDTNKQREFTKFKLQNIWNTLIQCYADLSYLNDAEQLFWLERLITIQRSVNNTLKWHIERL